MQKTILNTPYNLSLLADLGRPSTVQPRISHLIKALYENIFSMVLDGELEKEFIEAKTRIGLEGDKGVWKGEVFKKDQKVVVADVIRAGIQPSDQLYLKLTDLLNPAKVRQDHIMAQRILAEEGVDGSELSGSKIGGSIENSIVFIPDPMGATGGSMKEVIDFYVKNYGTPKKFVIVNLVITPEYLTKMENINVPISVYAARLDPGLTKNDYIYPGLGGVGEMINNTEHQILHNNHCPRFNPPIQ